MQDLKPDDWPWKVLRHEGYSLELDGEKLLVTPAPDDSTRGYILANREAIVAACRRVDALAAVFDELNRPLDEKRKKLKP